jgi:hypothetical protein
MACSIRSEAEAAQLARDGWRDAHRVRGHRAHGPHGGAASSGSPMDEKRRILRVEHRRGTDYLSGNNKGLRINGNAGPC